MFPYRYGHRAIDPRKQQPSRRNSGKQFLGPEECEVLIKDRLPAYISWERFQANQRRLQANQTTQDTPGPVRQGVALLGGLIYTLAEGEPTCTISHFESKWRSEGTLK